MRKIKKILLLVLIVLPLILLTACNKKVLTDYDRAIIDFNNLYQHTILDIEGYYYVGDNMIVVIIKNSSGGNIYLQVSIDNVLLIREE